MSFDSPQKGVTEMARRQDRHRWPAWRPLRIGRMIYELQSGEPA
jgi:hypothetical protein